MRRDIMLVIVLCCMMKIVELSTGRGKENQRPKRRCRRRPPRNKMIRSGKVMNEAECKVQDCNSNHTIGLVGGGAVGDQKSTTVSCLSNASSQDVDFVQDNSDYQWFLDYGYRDGGTHQHTSILSSLGESYGGPEDVGYYEALSKNLDANLAEADMESFRTEDIHALLTTLPAICTDMQLTADVGRRGEMFASVTGSMMAKFDLESSTSPHSSSQDSAASPDTMSICKSELLFSPVKEVPMPGANFSIDSLDCELYEEHDIMLTCQANKDNYTIAFEGSTIMDSEDSFHRDAENDWNRTVNNRQQKLDASMARSDSGLTTWSKLKKRSSENQLRRHPSGNNNTPADGTLSYIVDDNTGKSQSMPDLLKQCPITYYQPDTVKSNKSCVRVFDIQHQHGINNSYNSDMAVSMDTGSVTKKLQTHNFNLVKLFMKQKSASAEGMSTGTDQSSSETDSSFDGRKTRLERRQSDNLEDSLVDGKPRKHDSIREECELISEQSESVEQLSESASHTDSIFNSYDRFQKIPLNETNVNNNNSIGKNIEYETKKHMFPKHNLSTRLINRSMQTSFAEQSKYKPANDWIHVVEPSFLNKLKMESNNKPVYVVYPSYTLPDLEFLKTEQENVANVYLMPQKYPDDEDNTKKRQTPKGRRPFSCNDMEALKKKGFSHIRDWDSLTFLLPAECRQVLADVPEFVNIMKDRDNELLKPEDKPLFCATPPRPKKRPVSCEYTYKYNATNVSSSSSTTTQPSSGYRGSSTILSDSSQNSPAPTNNLNPLFVYRYDSVTSSEASLTTSERPRIAPPLPKRSISLQQSEQKLNKKLEIIPPRPPLPKGILRKNTDLKRKNMGKRYSMFEMGETDECSEEDSNTTRCARKSLHDPYYTGRRTFSEHSTETEDEGVEAGHGTDSSVDEHFETIKIRPPTPPLPKIDQCLGDMSCDELEQLEDFLKLSYISSSDPNEWDENELLKLRSLVGKFLSLKINKDCDLLGKKSVSFAKNSFHDTPPNSPNISAIKNHKNIVDMPICEEGESSPEGYGSPKHENIQPIDLGQKKQLISAVTQSVEQLIMHFASANDRSELENLGDAELNPSCGKLVLSTLCPALYALLSDGLRPSLNTPFGAINNSVWRVVEASAQQGPLTKALDELVTRINGQDVIGEGILKFNAFVFGLLSVRSLDAWMSYLRTRETILKKYYRPDALLVAAQTGGPSIRSLVDTSIATLQPLALLPFQIDLLFECKQLHSSLNRIDSYRRPPASPIRKISPVQQPANKQLTQVKSGYSIQSSTSCDESDDISTATIVRKYSPNSDSDNALKELINCSAQNRTTLREDKQRPRSCIDPNINLSQVGFKIDDGTIKKRWSGIQSGSKFVQAYDRLGAEDIESQDVELESIESHVEDPAPGGKFRRLQMKWEMLSGRDVSNQPSPPLSPVNTPGKSKIPRPVSASSPTKQTGIPVLSPKTPKQIASKVTTPPGIIRKPIPVGKSGIVPPKKTNVTRTSRVDQLEKPEVRSHPVRPSSLPYRPVSAGIQGNKGSKLAPARRAVSSSVNRKPQQQQIKTPKVVKTLTHRLPSDNGHLPFNEGEKLKVILEVDSKWLLCCRGDQKGLVPRSAVISIAVETAGFN